MSVALPARPSAPIPPKLNFIFYVKFQLGTYGLALYTSWKCLGLRIEGLFILKRVLEFSLNKLLTLLWTFLCKNLALCCTVISLSRCWDICDHNSRRRGDHHQAIYADSASVPERHHLLLVRCLLDILSPLDWLRQHLPRGGVCRLLCLLRCRGDCR